MRYPSENAYDAEVAAAAARYGVPGALLKAHVDLESQFNPRAANLTGGDGLRGGSYGLVQMSYKTAQLLGYAGPRPTEQDRAQLTGLYHPGTNLSLGAKYLAGLLREAATGGYGIDSAISAYNGGNSPLRRGDGKRPGVDRVAPEVAKRTPFSNQPYVDAVLSRLRYYLAAGAGAAAPAYAPAKASGDAAVAAALLGAAALVALAVAAGSSGK